MPLRNLDRQALDRVSQSAAPSRAHSGNIELLLLDRNATLTDTYLDASGLLPLLVELIANDHGNDDEHADNEVENVTLHSLVPRLDPENASSDQPTFSSSYICKETTSSSGL